MEKMVWRRVDGTRDGYPLPPFEKSARSGSVWPDRRREAWLESSMADPTLASNPPVGLQARSWALMMDSAPYRLRFSIWSMTSSSRSRSFSLLSVEE